MLTTIYQGLFLLFLVKMSKVFIINEIFLNDSFNGEVVRLDYHFGPFSQM